MRQLNLTRTFAHLGFLQSSRRLNSCLPQYTKEEHVYRKYGGDQKEPQNNSVLSLMGSERCGDAPNICNLHPSTKKYQEDGKW